MNKTSSLLMALLTLSATGVAFAGGTVHRVPEEAPAVEAPAPAPEPAPVPMAVTPAPAPIVVAPAYAPHAYVGGSLGRTHYQGGVNGSANATGGKLYAGYQFSPNFAAEAAYNTLGSANGSRSQGGSVDALGILPVSQNVDLFGKVGVADLKSTGGSYKAGANYGVGARYNLTQHVSARAELERFQKADTVGGKANQASAGVQYNF